MIAVIAASLQLYFGVQEATFGRLIGELASPEYTVREAATKRLSESPFALPQVRRIMWSGTPEQRTRARKIELAILAVTLPKREVELLRRATEWSKAGRLDLVTEVCSRSEFRSKERCETLYAAGNRVYATLGDREEKGKLVELHRGRRKILELGTRRERLLDIDGDPKSLAPRIPLLTSFGLSVVTPQPLFLSAARDRLDTLLDNGGMTLFSNGPAVGRLFHDSASVLVVDGDLTFEEHNHDLNNLGGHMSAAVVVVNGDLRFSANRVQANLSSGPSSCAFLVKGDVVIESPFLSVNRCRIIAGGKVKWLDQRGSISGKPAPVENSADPLAPFKFFALTEVGLYAKDVKREVVAEKIDAQSPFGRAGVQPGDVLVAVDGKPVPDVAQLRRLVRTGYVMGDCVVVVRRGDATAERVVRFPN